VVEDSAVLAERLQEMLTSLEGIRLAGVVDGEAAAIEALANNPVDVVLLDLHLRQGTGLGVLRELNKKGGRPVVIVFTNYDLAEYRRAAMECGAEYFLDKSFDMDRLPTIMEQLRSRERDSSPN
jgi:DNA-binding NarL/FixJ family response regulator